MDFNLYDLSSKSTIKVVVNEKIKEKLVNSLKNIKKKELASKLNIKYSTLWKWLNNKYIPLCLFEALECDYNIFFSNDITHLQGFHNKKMVKVPKKLDETLAKIIGAYISDGYLKDRTSKWLTNPAATHYEFVLREEYLTNVEAFCKWFNDCFDYNLKYIKRKNHYEVYISNKIIFYYFTKILKLKISPKTDIIYVPNYLKNSTKEFKLALLKGIFMFDGSVERNTGYVSLVSKSKRLVEEVYNLLVEIGIPPDYKNKWLDEYGRSRLIIRRKHKLVMCLSLFEKDTEKWVRLNNYIKKYSKV